MLQSEILHFRKYILNPNLGKSLKCWNRFVVSIFIFPIKNYVFKFLPGLCTFIIFYFFCVILGSSSFCLFFGHGLYIIFKQVNLVFL